MVGLFASEDVNTRYAALEILGACRPETVRKPEITNAVFELAKTDTEVNIVNAAAFYVLWPCYSLSKSAKTHEPKQGPGFDEMAIETFARAARMSWLGSGGIPSDTFFITATNLCGALALGNKQHVAAFMSKADPSVQHMIDEFQKWVEKDGTRLDPYRMYITDQEKNMEKEDKRHLSQIPHPHDTAAELFDGATQQFSERGMALRKVESAPM